MTVLWPKDFTVFDTRVCDELVRSGLDDFHFLANMAAERLWPDYPRYCEAVAGAVPGSLALRDKDRFLWGRSAAEQLLQDIERGFAPAYVPAA
jgi:hypothetical protein